MPTLTVRQLRYSDVYRDIIRVNKTYRTDERNKDKPLKEGQVYLIRVRETKDGRVRERKCLAVLRGYEASAEPEIRMDDFTRGEDRLDVKWGEPYDFEFKKVWLIGRLRWAWNASEMGYRVASQIAIVSFFLGLWSLLLTIDWHSLRCIIRRWL
jgi:hypothetical protein